MANKTPSFSTCIVLAALIGASAVTACGSDDARGGTSGPPAGACRTGGTATGSFSNTCTQCAQQKCNAEMSNKSGSGWASQYLGGDGTCKDFNACLCTCLAADSGDPITCTTTTCIGKLDSACQQAISAAQNCLAASCSTEC